MHCAITLFSSERSKTFALWLILLLISWYANGQTCPCPQASSCGTCDGGITSLTLKFIKTSASFVTISDDGGDLHSGVLNVGDVITITGSLPNGKFKGGEITIQTAGSPVIVISTDCETPIYPNSVLGSFTVVSGLSKNGGSLCCAAPVIFNCPSNINTTLGASCSKAVTWTAPTASTCSAVTITSTHNSGAAFSKGTTAVTYTATDGFGNTAACTFNVTVIDDMDPVMTGCPSNITAIANSSCQAIVSWTPPIATDNCTVSLTSTHNPGVGFPKGITPVTYTATDGSGNTTTCTFNVIVNDTVRPAINECPGNITLVANSNCQAVANWTAPTSADNCSATTLRSTHRPGETFTVGTTPVTYTATDASGNTAVCTFDVVVVDNASPVISGCVNADIVALANPSCQANVSWTDPVVEGCGTVTLTSNHKRGDIFQLGTTEVIYTATDESGNSTSCKFNVVVKDQSAPVFTNSFTEVNARASASCDAIVNWVEPSITDCGSVTVNKSHRSGDTFPIGITEVEYSATDNFGNKSVCQFKVIVKNEIIPVITGCRGDILVKANQSGYVAVDWIKPAAISPCSAVSFNSSHNPGDVFGIGTTEVEYKAIDEVGNFSKCTFRVIVSPQDLEIDVPQIITPDGDGINDSWTLLNIEKFKENKIVILDRWGSVIYHALGYNNESIVWSGASTNGKMVPTGTYFYTISVNSGAERIEKRGFIELIR